VTWPIRNFALVVGCLALAHWGCSDSAVAGGGPSGSEAGNSIAIHVQLPDGKPAAGVAVRVRMSSYLPADSLPCPNGRVLDSGYANLLTNSDGSVVVEGLRGGSYRIEALDGDQAGQFLSAVTTQRRSLAVIALGPTGTVAGRIAGGRSGAWIGVQGTEHRARTGSDGSFRLAGLPAGSASLRAIDGSEQGIQSVRPREVVSAGVLRPELAGELFLDDFEDGDTYHRYAAVSGNGWWYAAKASALTSVPDDIAGHPENALLTDSVTGNRYLEWSVSNPLNISEGWAEFGVGLGAKSTDLRKLSAISFRVRGSGTVQVRLHSTHLQSKQFYGAAVSMASTWTDVTVPLSSFKVEGPGADTVRAANLLDSCSGIAWSFGPVGKIDLDDIRLTGVGAAMLWGELIAP